jgi:hypothetical protein
MVVEMKDAVSIPLAESAPTDQFSMIIDIVQGTEYQRVTVPGVIIQGGDPEFVAGVHWGRTSYFEDVYRFLDKDGNEVHQFTLEELAELREVKVRDITIVDAIQFIMETAQDENTSEAWRAGFIFGYVTACSDQFYGLACDNCGQHLGECHCKKEIMPQCNIGDDRIVA